VRLIFFLINFIGGTLVLIACLVSVIVPLLAGGGSPGSFLGGVSFAPLAGLFVLGEWRVFYRRKHALEGALNIACLLLAGLLVFGVGANSYQAWKNHWPNGFAWFVAVLLAIAGYLTACAVWRIRHPK
jgi:hypothetical protein